MADTNTNQNKPASVKSGKSKTAVWGGVAFLLFVIAGLVFGGLKANQYLQDEQQMPVQVIRLPVIISTSILLSQAVNTRGAA